MSVYDASNLLINGLMALATLALAVFAFREVREGARTRAADTTAVRYLLIGEIHRLTLPYRRLLEEWTGEGHVTYPQGALWESTSEAWRTGLARLPQLTRTEQTQLSRLNILFAELPPERPQSHRFEAQHKSRMRAILSEVDAAAETLARHLPAEAAEEVRRLRRGLNEAV